MILEPNTKHNFTRDEWLSHLALVNNNRVKAGMKILTEKEIFAEEEQNIRELILIKIASKQTPKATELIVEEIKKKYVIKSIRQDEKKEMWIYEEGIYVENAISYIQEMSRDLLGEMFTTYICNNVVAKIESDTYIEQKEFFNQQNKYPYLIPVQNGILNLKTKELEEFTPYKYFFNKLNVYYDHKAECPNFIKFLNDITEKEEDRLGLQEMFGYSMIKEYKYEKAFMLHGELGRNGKSKLLSVLREMLGIKNCAEQSLQKLEEDNFNLVELHNKLVNISADISKQAMNNTGNFKALTGRDTINGQRKFKTGLQFVNYAKMIFACNDLPFINKNENAVWLRWVYIPFPYQFLPQEEINTIPEKERNTIKLQDPEIIKKITTPEEFSGILNWAIEGLQRLEEQRDFSNSKSSNKLKELWMKKSSSALAFCLDNIKEDWDGFITQKEFRQKYIQYCKKNKLSSLSNKAIKVILESEYGASENFKKYIDNYGYEDRTRVWSGVSFINKNNLNSFLDNDETHRNTRNTENTYVSNSIVKNNFAPRVQNLCVSCVSCAEDNNNECLHVINSMLVGEKYTLTTLSVVTNIDEEKLEQLLNKAINVGDVMIIDGKYMLVN